MGDVLISFSQQRIISVFGNAHQSTYEKYAADMGQTVMALKYKKNPEAEAAASTYEHKPPSATPSQKHTAAERVASSGVSQSKLYISGAAQPH